jgi:hypothetical protein
LLSFTNVLESELIETAVHFFGLRILFYETAAIDAPCASYLWPVFAFRKRARCDADEFMPNFVFDGVVHLLLD